MDRLVDKLRIAHKKEQANIVTNPLRQIVDLLSLTPLELEAWMQVFEKIDTAREGAISFDQIFEFFEETYTLFARTIFTDMDALDEYGTVEFGDFVRAVGAYMCIAIAIAIAIAIEGRSAVFSSFLCLASLGVTVMSLRPLIQPR